VNIMEDRPLTETVGALSEAPAEEEENGQHYCQ
jgi:hypothetical protein